MREKRVVMFAGANGSGKSTRVASLKDSLPDYYICPDNLLNNSIDDEKDRYVDAMNKAELLRKAAISKGDSFVFETVFSTQDKLDFLVECNRNGYYIWTIYMATNNPRINNKRIKERVKNGGHNVPGLKVVERYYKSMNYLQQIIRVSDEVQVYDNSYKAPFCVFIKYNNTMILLNKEYRKEWVDRYIVKHYREDIKYDLTVAESSNFV